MRHVYIKTDTGGFVPFYRSPTNRQRHNRRAFSVYPNRRGQYCYPTFATIPNRPAYIDLWISCKPFMPPERLYTEPGIILAASLLHCLLFLFTFSISVLCQKAPIVCIDQANLHYSVKYPHSCFQTRFEKSYILQKFPLICDFR